jgi:hypothetical protein
MAGFNLITEVSEVAFVFSRSEFRRETETEIQNLSCSFMGGMDRITDGWEAGAFTFHRRIPRRMLASRTGIDPTRFVPDFLSALSEQCEESASIEEASFVCSLTPRRQEALDARIAARFIMLLIPGEHILDRREQFMMSLGQLEDMSRAASFGIVELNLP